MKVLQVKKFPLWDIFMEDGWDHWSRYLFKKGKLIYVSGSKITNKTTLSQVTKEIQNAIL